MTRPHRTIPEGAVVHVLNRAVDRRTIFHAPEDFMLFLELVRWAAIATGVPILSYSVMPNHWHFVLKCVVPGDISRFMHLLTSVHARRWRLGQGSVGLGHLYQDRFKCFEINGEIHLEVVLRYVDRNALTAGLVTRAEDWPWCSLAQRLRGMSHAVPPLAPLPMPVSSAWLDVVNAPHAEKELAAFRRSIELDRPFGPEDWVRAHPSLRRGRGRPSLTKNSG
jgi:putative transposase